MNILQKRAIEAALDQQWEQAVKLNQQIIKELPEDIDALNRQAKAYLELGKFDLARKFYSRTLKIDPYNPIAQKNLKMIKSFKNREGNTPVIPNGNGRVSPSLFLQEPGKTKVVPLLKVAEPQKLSKLYPGMQLDTAVKNRKLTVIDPNGIYIGVLPDDLSHQLLRMINGGNKYDLFVRSVKVNGVAVLIREAYRSKRFKNQPSFLETSNFVTNDIITKVNTDEGSSDNEDEELSEEEETA